MNGGGEPPPYSGGHTTMESKPAQDTAILIPSYKPDHKLAPYVQELREAGFGKIVIVDDGSGSDYAPIFQSIPHDDTVHIIQYEPNCGKGVALKRGMEYLWNESQCAYVITADSDGQHTAADTLRMCESLHAQGDGLLLGSRNFSEAHVPAKSMMGNRITTAVFFVLYGRWIGDTQTGLRGFARELLPQMMAVRGDRYEYEMNMLIDCATKKTPIRPLPIETVYENNNDGSHFRAVRDSARIYWVIFSGFIRFISTSLTCFLTDYGLYLLLLTAQQYKPGMAYDFRFLIFHIHTPIMIATIVARLVSGSLNFFLNKKFVFSDHHAVRKTLPRYLGVFILIMLLSFGLTSSLHEWFGVSERAVKLPVDILLFWLSYQLQRRWVFGTSVESGE